MGGKEERRGDGGGGVNTRMAYLREVNWVTYLGGPYIRGGGLLYGGSIKGILRYLYKRP